MLDAREVLETSREEDDGPECIGLEAADGIWNLTTEHMYFSRTLPLGVNPSQ